MHQSFKFLGSLTFEEEMSESDVVVEAPRIFPALPSLSPAHRLAIRRCNSRQSSDNLVSTPSDHALSEASITVLWDQI